MDKQPKKQVCPDVTFVDTGPGCNLRSIDKRCIQIVNLLKGSDLGGDPLFTLSCPGYDPIYGCQGHFEGEIVEQDGNVIEVDITSAKLAATALERQLNIEPQD
jgi:hypothetical protein